MTTAHRPVFHTRQLLVICVLLAIFAILFSGKVHATDCPSAPIEFSSQAEVDAFQDDMGPCDTITHDLTITGPDITNLDGLSGLVEVWGNLYITGNPVLTDMQGLSSLGDVGGIVSITFNPGLTDMQGLSKLDYAGYLMIENNLNLTRLDGLDALRGATVEVRITNNPALIDVTGLSSLSAMDSLYIENNATLTSLDGLDDMDVISYVSVINNPLLYDCQDLASLFDTGDESIAQSSALSVPAGAVLFHDLSNNLTGCNSVEEILASADPAKHFVTTWQTDGCLPGCDGQTAITLPVIGGPYDVDWDNDGFFDEYNLNAPVTHDFGQIGNYTVRIRGDYHSFHTGADSENAQKILSLDQWGNQAWSSMRSAFIGASNLQVPATDTPDFSAVSDMSYMFAEAAKANPDTSDWNTAAVTTMRFMFAQAAMANPDISNWDTGEVTDMGFMFWGATSFDRNVGGWDVGKLSDALIMFGDVTLSQANYESLLLGWNAQTLQQGVSFSGGNSTYCSAAAIAARANIIASNAWTISDGGQVCFPDAPLSAPDLTPGSDTGTSDSDDFTLDNTPDFFVECSTIGNTINLYTDHPAANTAVGTLVCTSTGTEVLSVTTTLAPGTHNVTYTDEDANGESGHSPALAVTVDMIHASGFE